MKQKKLPVKSKGIKISEVEYSVLKSWGMHNNSRIGAKASVRRGESPGAVLEELIRWVEKFMDAKLKMEAEKYAMGAQVE